MQRRGQLDGGEDWVSIQVAGDLFQMRGGGNENSCRWIRAASLSQEAAPEFDGHGPRQLFALANLADRYVAVTGGYIEQKSQHLYSSHRFDLQANRWEGLPNMKIHREGHSSCSIDGNLYVFCGINANKMPINSIEVLDDACSALDLIQGWREIQVSEAILTPRWVPACVPVNEDQIAIIGGISFDANDDPGVMGDVVLYDTTEGTVERKVINMPGLLQICSYGNQAASVGDDTVVVLGMDEDRGNIRAVQFKKGVKMLKNLGTL